MPLKHVRNPAGLIYSVVKAKGNTRVGVIRKGEKNTLLNTLKNTLLNTLYRQVRIRVMTGLRRHVCDFLMLYRHVRIRTRLVPKFFE